MGVDAKITVALITGGLSLFWNLVKFYLDRKNESIVKRSDMMRVKAVEVGEVILENLGMYIIGIENLIFVIKMNPDSMGLTDERICFPSWRKL